MDRMVNKVHPYVTSVYSADWQLREILSSSIEMDVSLGK